MSSLLNDDSNRLRVSRSIIEQIKNYILENSIQAGDLLPSELELADKFQVSKSSIRESIKMLEILGIVEIKRGIGTIYTNNTHIGFQNTLYAQLVFQQGYIKEFIDFRRVFETAYTKLAAENATEEDLLKMKQSIINYENNINNGIVNVHDDIDFHQQVLAASHNNFIISLGSAINLLYVNSIEESVKYRPEIAIQDHYSIYQAIVDKDYDSIESNINKSIDVWSDILTSK
ncbi:MAG: FadR/GntR family transcriptional regulator [Tissierellaceae bacterium]|nr:FadR/GntR family transcriptional regulator [Tissierellaceae bacterium]